MIYFLIFLSFLLNLFANSSVTENDPSSLVNGVSVITGDFYSYNEDYLVEGAEPISIRRAYLSNGSLLIDRPHLFASLLSTLNAIVITEPNGTQLFYQADTNNGLVPKIGDSFFGESKKPKALYYRSKTFTESSTGITNTSTGKISGQTHLQNQFIVFDPGEDPKGKSFSLFTVDGTKRRYVNLERQTME